MKRDGMSEERGERVSGVARRWMVFAACAVAVALRALYLAQPWRVDWRAFPMFLGDEGAHGLMGLHILEAGIRPVFFYGGYYQGALEPYLLAGIFRGLDASLLTLRLLPVVGALLSIPLAYLVGRRVYGQLAGVLAASLVAVPSTFAFHWGAIAVCPYGTYAPLVLGIVYLSLLLLERVTVVRLLALGLLTGVATWSLPLVAGYALVCGAALLLWAGLSRRQVVAALVAFLVGVSPLIYGNIEYPLATVKKLARKVRHSQHLAAQPQDPEDREFLSQPYLQIAGVQPGRDGSTSKPGIPGAVFLGLGLLGAALHCASTWFRSRHRARGPTLLLGCLAVGAALGIGGLSGQPVGRYLLPLHPLASLLAAGWLATVLPRIAFAVVTAVLVANAVAIALPPPWDGSASRREVMAALEERDLLHGYAAGQMYELSFRSHERIRIVPLDHARVHRYRDDVAAAERVFYIYRTDQQDKAGHRALMGALRNAQYQQLRISDHHILYDFVPSDVVAGPAMRELIRRYKAEKWGDGPNE